MTTLGVGVLGCANIARKTVRGIKRSDVVKVVAVGSRDKAKAERFVSETGLDGADALGSYEAVLEHPGVDAVYLPLPTKLHADWVEKAAAAGKHIVLEKPIAVDEADLERIVAAVKKHGVQLFDGTMWMHHPRKKAIEARFPDIGGPKLANVTFSFAGSPEFFQHDIRLRRSGDPLGALGDIGWYCTRCILWAFNWDAPLSVAAGPGTLWALGADEGDLRIVGDEVEGAREGVPVAMTAGFSFSGGRIASFTVSFETALTCEARIVGPTGTIHFDDMCIPRVETEASWTVETKPGFVNNDTLVKSTLESVTTPNDKPQETLLWEEFAAQVGKGGRGADPFWPKIAARTQRVLFAIMESAQKGGARVAYSEPEEDKL